MGFSSINHLKDQRPSAFPDPPTPSVPKQPHLDPQASLSWDPGLFPGRTGGAPSAWAGPPAVGWGLELEGGASSPGWL